MRADFTFGSPVSNISARTFFASAMITEPSLLASPNANPLAPK